MVYFMLKKTYLYTIWHINACLCLTTLSSMLEQASFAVGVPSKLMT